MFDLMSIFKRKMPRNCSNCLLRFMKSQIVDFAMSLSYLICAGMHVYFVLVNCGGKFTF